MLLEPPPKRFGWLGEENNTYWTLLDDRDHPFENKGSLATVYFYPCPMLVTY